MKFFRDKIYNQLQYISDEVKLFVLILLNYFEHLKMEVEIKEEINGTEDSANTNSPASSSAPPPLLKQPQAPGLKVPQIAQQSRYKDIPDVWFCTNSLALVIFIFCYGFFLCFQFCFHLLSLFN